MTTLEGFTCPYCGTLLEVETVNDAGEPEGMAHCPTCERDFEQAVSVREIHVCAREGCDSTDTIPCYLEPGDEPDEWYCGEHITAAGYCWGCGRFWAGIESFDLSPSGLCENCQSSGDYDEVEVYADDLDFGWEYPFDWYDGTDSDEEATGRYIGPGSEYEGDG